MIKINDSKVCKLNDGESNLALKCIKFCKSLQTPFSKIAKNGKKFAKYPHQFATFLQTLYEVYS